MDDIQYKILRILEKDPCTTQRQIATELGISLGKANYCLRALIERGWVKARNFTNSRNKHAYLYLLTPQGAEQKARVAIDFLRRKMSEYEALQKEIRELRQEINSQQHYSSTHHKSSP